MEERLRNFAKSRGVLCRGELKIFQVSEPMYRGNPNMMSSGRVGRELVSFQIGGRAQGLRKT